MSLPAGVPVQLAREIEHIAQAIFTNGFVDAMRSTMLLPIVVLVVGAASCVLIKRMPTAPSLAAAGGRDGAPAAVNGQAAGPATAAAPDGVRAGHDDAMVGSQDGTLGQDGTLSQDAGLAEDLGSLDRS